MLKRFLLPALIAFAGCLLFFAASDDTAMATAADALGVKEQAPNAAALAKKSRLDKKMQALFDTVAKADLMTYYALNPNAMAKDRPNRPMSFMATASSGSR